MFFYRYSKTSFIGTPLKCKHLVYRDLEGSPTTTHSFMVGCHDYCCYPTSCDYVQGVVVGGETKCPDKWVRKIPINECPDKRGFTFSEATEGYGRIRREERDHCRRQSQLVAWLTSSCWFLFPLRGEAMKLELEYSILYWLFCSR